MYKQFQKSECLKMTNEKVIQDCIAKNYRIFHWYKEMIQIKEKF